MQHTPAGVREHETLLKICR